MNKQLKFLGVVTVGNTRAEAEQRHRSVSSGAGVVAMRDEDEQIALLTDASSLSTVFNPISGNTDLVTDPAILEGMTFQAEAGAEAKEVFYVHCSDGCGAHVVSDTPIAYCPSCISLLGSTSSDEAEVEDAEDGEVEDETEVEDEVEDEEPTLAEVDEGHRSELRH